MKTGGKKRWKARRHHHHVKKILLACVVFAFALASVAPVFRKHEQRARLDATHPHRFDASAIQTTMSKTTRTTKEEEEKKKKEDSDDARGTGGRAFACPDIREHCEYDGAVVLDGVAAGPTKSLSLIHI